jgi:hypothetical protein
MSFCASCHTWRTHLIHALDSAFTFIAGTAMYSVTRPFVYRGQELATGSQVDLPPLTASHCIASGLVAPAAPLVAPPSDAAPATDAPPAPVKTPPTKARKH